MKNLQLTQINGVFYADSREVSQMIEKIHKNLLRDIDGYVEALKSEGMDPGDFFIENAAEKTTEQRSYRYYNITKKGCDMVANKMTGVKGVVFTAKYINAFYEMQEKLKENIILQLEESKRAALASKDEALQKLEALQEKFELIKEERDDLLKGIDYVSTPAPRSAIKYNVRWFLRNFCYETTQNLIPCSKMYELFLSATASTGIACSRSIFEDVMYELNKRICYQGNIRAWDYTGVYIDKIRNRQ